MIFAYALSHGDTKLHIIPSIQDGSGGTGCWKHRSWPDPVNVSLLYVCRQIHLETALFPYELNVFVVYGHYNAAKDFFELICSHPNPYSSAFISEMQPKYASMDSSRKEVNKERAIIQRAEKLKVEAAQQELRLNQM
ncbi:hypothetical protein J4E93_004088 [Alternaria ventricosa]|uniref:uncharacterized protein n=1 Tax=Alternaria ventricosa TaxID=1187951 RepID=UPI0020C2D28F|nr:uncharacterized protein J4E93_004088 [Alternaria ventricosa]KAI4647678.1 hypothetical protein J4E93_004088 [Alternaria ventricosa]